MRNLKRKRKRVEKLEAYFLGGWIFWDLTAAKFLDGEQQVGRTPTSLTVEGKRTWLIKRWNDILDSTRRNICNSSSNIRGMGALISWIQRNSRMEEGNVGKAANEEDGQNIAAAELWCMQNEKRKRKRTEKKI